MHKKALLLRHSWLIICCDMFNEWFRVGRTGTQWGPMSVEPRHTGEDLPLHSTRQIDAVCDLIEASLKLAGGVAIEPYLGRVEGRGRKLLITELALLTLGQPPRKVFWSPCSAFEGKSYVT